MRDENGIEKGFFLFVVGSPRTLWFMSQHGAMIRAFFGKGQKAKQRFPRASPMFGRYTGGP